MRQETLPAVKPARSEVRSAPVETVTKPAYAVVVQCTGVFDIGDLVQMNLGSDPRTKLFITPTRGDRVRLWNLIIELSPATKGLSSEQAINTMTQIRDNYIRTNLARYEADIDVLVADYRRCQDLGLIPRQ